VSSISGFRLGSKQLIWGGIKLLILRIWKLHRISLRFFRIKLNLPYDPGNASYATPTPAAVRFLKFQTLPYPCDN